MILLCQKDPEAGLCLLDLLQHDSMMLEHCA
jgi:hypothetical protein